MHLSGSYMCTTPIYNLYMFQLHSLGVCFFFSFSFLPRLLKSSSWLFTMLFEFRAFVQGSLCSPLPHWLCSHMYIVLIATRANVWFKSHTSRRGLQNEIVTYSCLVLHCTTTVQISGQIQRADIRVCTNSIPPEVHWCGNSESDLQELKAAVSKYTNIDNSCKQTRMCKQSIKDLKNFIQNFFAKKFIRPNISYK